MQIGREICKWGDQWPPFDLSGSAKPSHLPFQGEPLGRAEGRRYKTNRKARGKAAAFPVFLCWGIQRSRRSCGSGCAKSVLGKPMGDAPSARSARAASLPSSKTKSGRLMLCR